MGVLLKLSREVSELIGAIIGDGNIYSAKKKWVEITGNRYEDRHYFQNVLARLIKLTLSYNARIYFRSDAIRLRIFKSTFVDYLKFLGIPSGRGKSLTVLIPAKIRMDWKLAKSCIRGIYDTDGSLTFDKRPTYARPYPRVVLHVSNFGLMNQLSDILSDKKFNPKLSYKESSLYLNGKTQVKLYLSTIGFSNIKHLNRLKRYYPEFLPLNSANAPVTQW